MNEAKKSLVGGSKTKAAAAKKIDTSNESEFEKAKQIGGPGFNAQPLTGNIFVPTGGGVSELIQKNGQPPVVGFTFILSEYHQPLTFVFSKADAKTMKEMLDKVLKAGN